ncbi:SET domain-containing protein [Penicillium herquei]|nr:SET domain-containing protein [Penicillium herquei]
MFSKTSTHHRRCLQAYCRLQIPNDAPFELKPSPGKGWGAFATRQIVSGCLILREEPLFVIRGHHTEITDQHIAIALERLPPIQQAQFLLLRHNASQRFSSLNDVLAENSFNIANADHNEHSAHGLFPLHSRFNHSCIPNCKIPKITGEIISSFATMDIAIGEEITFCYETDFEGRVSKERHEALRFVCDCKACLPGTAFQNLSDIRRRLIRGLQYLLLGVDLDGLRQNSHNAIIVDSNLKNMAEKFNIPLSSRLVYNLLTMFLLEEEGLLDEFMVKRLGRSLIPTARFFESEWNSKVAWLALSQDTWLEKLVVGLRLYGFKDTGDYKISQILSQLHN